MKARWRWIGLALATGAVGIKDGFGAQAPIPLGLERLTPAAGCFEPVEFRLSGVPEVSDPFDPEGVDVRLEVIRPDGSSCEVPAFFDQEYERRSVQGRDWFYPSGKPGWKARFAGTTEGMHAAVAVLRTEEGVVRSSTVRFECGPARRPGFLRVSRKDPRFLELSTGEPFFAIGQNLAFIGDQQYVTLSKAERIFRQLGDNGANYVRVWTCCEDWALAIEARKSAWGRSWDWRPPFAADPADPTRQCILLPANRESLDASPSHAVGLKPDTRYDLTGRLRTEPEAALVVEVAGSRSVAFRSPDTEWVEWRHEFTTGPQDFWLGNPRFRRVGEGRIWLDALSLREVSEGPELLWEAAVNRDPRGFFNPLDCFLLDELLRSAAQNGLYLQLCLLTRDLYMPALKDPQSEAYAQAIADARRFMRYAVARWGAFPSVGAWEYWNEMDPGLPTDRFYTELGEYLEKTDPWRHLRTTSTWGPSPKDCRHPKLDLADTHFYLRPTDRGRLANEVEAVVERTAWLRAQAPAKPAHLGEFGLADDRWRLREEMRQRTGLTDAHNALWASALSGASGTALFWWWERLDAEGVYRLYDPLSRFIRDLPWNRGTVEPLRVIVDREGVRAMGLRAGREVWLWLFQDAAAWERAMVAGETVEAIQGLRVTLPDLTNGAWRVAWHDTRTGDAVGTATVTTADQGLTLAAPVFKADLAVRLSGGPR